MSQLIVPAPASPPPQKQGLSPQPVTRHARWQKRLLAWGLVCAVFGVASYYGVRSYRALTLAKQPVIPVAKVQRGDVSLAITARGELRWRRSGDADGSHDGRH